MTVAGDSHVSGELSGAHAEEHAHALLFSTANANRYLYDAATNSVHAWPWALAGTRLEELYRCADGEIEGLVRRAAAPAWLADYLLAWRAKAAAFGATAEADPSAAPCASCASPPASRTSEPQRVSPTAYANLMLILTDACNLRCRYCVFSGQYEQFHDYRSRSMSRETARRAIEHFFALNEHPSLQGAANRKINIAFFGGEPLLEQEVLRDAVAFAKAHAKSHYVLDFSVTTNLTYLPDDLAAFLVEQEIALQVSLDGPAEEHDRYRCYLDGRGSFAEVRRNLEKLRWLSPKFFAERVRAVVTLNGNSDLEAINRFFESGDPAVPDVAFAGYIRDLAEAAFHKRYPFDAVRLRRQYDKLLDEYLRLKREGRRFSKSQFFRHLFEEPLSILYRRVMHTGARHSFKTGTCQPGRRIAVGADGTFHICERISEGFPIGDAILGLDPARCQAVQNAYDEALPDCDRCWARSICNICFAHVSGVDRFEFTKGRCAAVRAEMAHQLGVLYTILEQSPDPFPSGDPLVDRLDFARGCCD